MGGGGGSANRPSTEISCLSDDGKFFGGTNLRRNYNYTCSSANKSAYNYKYTGICYLISRDKYIYNFNFRSMNNLEDQKKNKDRRTN